MTVNIILLRRVSVIIATFKLLRHNTISMTSYMDIQWTLLQFPWTSRLQQRRFPRTARCDCRLNHVHKVFKCRGRPLLQSQLRERSDFQMIVVRVSCTQRMSCQLWIQWNLIPSGCTDVCPWDFGLLINSIVHSSMSTVVSVSISKGTDKLLMDKY